MGVYLNYKGQSLGRRRRQTRFGMRHAGMLGTTALSALCCTAPAIAQSGDSATTSDDVIIVTAQRRAEALENVPMTVSVISNEVMESSGVSSLRDIANVTTGFQLGQAGAYPQPAIRGITTLIAGTYENNVAVYIDGFYQHAPRAISIDLPNVESVQVLKGPQGTLYGRNATGGAILLNTITPGETWKGKIELTYARFDDKRVSGYVSGPLSGKVGISVSGYLRRSDSYVKLASRTVPGETDGNAAPLEQDAVRIKLKADLTENFRAILAYNYTHVSDSRGSLLTVIENIPPVDMPAAATIPGKLGVAAWDIDQRVESKQHEGTLTLELDTGIGLLKSYTGYSKFTVDGPFDTDGSYLNGAWADFTVRHKTFQQALDYQIDLVENLDLTLGANYYRNKQKFIEPFRYYVGAANDSGATEVPLSQYTLFFSQYFQEKKEAWAIYADATYHMTDALSINFGGRYSKEKQDAWGEQVSPLPPPFGPFLTRAPNSASTSFSQFTPRASIRYEVAPRTNIYLSYSKGFRSGAFNSILPANPSDWAPAKQETVDAFEIGVKSAASRLRYELAGFYYDYKDLQVSATIAGPSGNLISQLLNAPKAKIYGVEASFDFKPLENLTVRGGALWLHARYGDGTILDGVGVDPTKAGINTNSNPLKTYLNVGQTQDLSGLQMARAPDFSANLGADYFIPNGEGGLRFAVNMKYTDSYVVTNPGVWGPLVAPEFQRKQRFRQGSYALLNASVTWTDPADHYYIRVWGNNLTDHRYRIHYTGNASWGSYSPMGEPLTFGGTVGYKF